MSSLLTESSSTIPQAGHPIAPIIIMVVDDDIDDAQLIQETISEIAPTYHVTTINKSEQVMDMLNGMDNTQLPSLLILDYNMPILSGLYLLQQIKANSRLAHIPVVVYSNSVYPKHKQECMEAGACIYLSKSATVQALKEDMEKLLAYCL